MDLQRPDFLTYVLIGSVAIAVLAIILYYMPGGKIKLPAMMRPKRILPGLAAGVCLLILGCSGNNEGETFVTTKSGLKYADLRKGTGREAKNGDYVTVHYTGWLRDGKKFDSSRDRDRPFSFRLGNREVIQGWDEGVAGMKIGGKRKLIIPSDLAYGKKGQGDIPPDAELTFEVELLNVR